MRHITPHELVGAVRNIVVDNQLTLNINSGADQCQLQCVYCSVRPFNTHDFREMTKPELRIQLEFAGSVLGDKLKHIHFFGREPLMSPTIIEEARRLMPNVTITITTNGVALQQDKQLQKMLKRINAVVTILSIDGPYHSSHRPTRTGENSLDLAIQAWEQLDDYKFTHTSVRSTYLPGESLVDYFKFQQDVLHGQRITPMPDIHTSMFDSKDVEEKVRELADYFGNQDPPSESYKGYLYELEGKRRKRRAFCSVGMFAIGPGLDVYTCHHQPDDVKIANIAQEIVYDENIKFVLNARSMSVDTVEKCLTCHNRQFCPAIGACSMQFLKAGNIMEPNDSFCEFSKGFQHGCFYWLSLRTRSKLLDALNKIGGDAYENTVS